VQFVNCNFTFHRFKAIKQLIADEDLCKKFKENCRTASQELNWENEVKNLLEKL